MPVLYPKGGGEGDVQQSQLRQGMHICFKIPLWMEAHLSVYSGGLESS